MQLTNEQKDIVNYINSNNECLVKINAFAGTGKTTTLLEIAKQELKNNPKAKILYLAFNKAIQEEAKNKFPRSVEIRTTHSLAYQSVMKGLNELKLKGSEYKLRELEDIIVNRLNVDKEVHNTFKLFSKEINTYFKEYLNSEYVSIKDFFDIDVTLKVFDEVNSIIETIYETINYDGEPFTMESLEHSKNVLSKIKKNDINIVDKLCATRYFSKIYDLCEKRLDTNEMVEIDRLYTDIYMSLGVLAYDEKIINVIDILVNSMFNGTIELTHSGYLKLYQIKVSNKRIRKKWDLILLDEAQDTNDVTKAIFIGLKAKKKVLVGDKHQQIYTFRGSKNIMAALPDYKEFYLTKTFRFGNNIAAIANNILLNTKGEKQKIESAKILNEQKKEDKTFAILSRTNAGLIDFILETYKKTSKELSDKEKSLVIIKTVRNPWSIFGFAINLEKILANERGSNQEIDKEFSFLNMYLDDYNRYKNNIIEDNFFSYLQMVGEKYKDIELTNSLSVLQKIYQFNKKYNDNLSIRTLYNYIVKMNTSIKVPMFYISTIHTAKGLEWNNIRLLDDVKDVLMLGIARILRKSVIKRKSDYFINKIKVDEFKLEDERSYGELFMKLLQSNFVNKNMLSEFNLYYVAVTRAMDELFNEQIFNNGDLKEYIDIEIENYFKIIDKRNKKRKN